MNWAQRPEGGGRFALWLIRTIALLGGRRMARALLLPITAYFVLRRGPERRASRAFLSRVSGRRATLLECARHVHCFASTILDRVFLLSERFRRFDIRCEGLNDLHRTMDEGRGVLLFGAHVGSFDALRVLSLQRPDVKLRVVLDVAHNPALTQLLGALNPDIARTVIDARQDGASIALQIKHALDEGALVTLLVDRALPGQPTVPVTLLSDTAPLPTAPWLLAATLGAPVVLCFGLYRGGNRYDLCFEHFSDGIALARRERQAALAAVAQRYAQRLEHHVRRAPYNWFNFYDVWQSDTGETSREPFADDVDAAARDRGVLPAPLRRRRA